MESGVERLTGEVSLPDDADEPEAVAISTTAVVANPAATRKSTRRFLTACLERLGRAACSHGSTLSAS
jgi:hypothetical protein